MEILESGTGTALDQLGDLYARPTERVLRKEIDHVDAAGRAFIAASPFLVLATGSSQGLDCSPKCDQPGFVQVEDDGRTVPMKAGDICVQRGTMHAWVAKGSEPAVFAFVLIDAEPVEKSGKKLTTHYPTR